jgi:ABC-2 type transport system permease protein
MSIISLIIKREFIAKVRNKSFIVMTFVSPLIFVAIAAFVGYLSTMKADIKKVAIHDESGIFASHFVNTEEHQFHDLSQVSIDLVKDSLISNGYLGILYIPSQQDLKLYESKIQFISNESPSLTFIANLERVIESQLTKSNYKKLDLDVSQIESAQSEVNIQLSKSSGEETVKGFNEIKIIIGGAFGYLIMMFIIIYGNLVMRSVIEEKTNRIIEIIISSVRPFQLMIGKIIGTSLAGILQFLIWAILGGVLFAVFSMFFGVKMGAGSAISPEMMDAAQAEMSTMQLYVKELWNLPIFTIFITFILYFVGGYFLYSSFYAAIGAAVDNETDSQQFLLPIMMPLILAIYIGFFTVINDPHGNIATIFSFVPLTSPIVMLMRIPFGVPVWQIVLSLTILFATFIFVVWFASKIYRVGILMYGKKPTWKELYQWMKY